MSLDFAVVHEAPADFRTATELADRMLCATIDWLDEELVIHLRTWLAESPAGHNLTWKGIKPLAIEAGIVVQGHFDDEPAQPDAAAAQRAIRYLRTKLSELGAILLIRDQDDQPERKNGLEQARGQPHGDLVIVVGLAIVERESWVLCGYDPLDDSESARLASARKELGFDPRTQSQELTACKNDQAKRSPKRVLRELVGDDWVRECRCWRETALTTLRERGSANGLKAYLDEVRDKLAPKIGHVTSK